MTSTPNGTVSPSPLFQRFDRVTWATIVILSLFIAIVLWHGEQIPLQVTNFSWNRETIGTGDRSFFVSFNRPVDRESVETHLTIDPPLPGTIAWRGNTLVYTLTQLPLYGTRYQLKLTEATKAYNDRAIEPFAAGFRSRDRAFAYLGIEGEERGRLILQNITEKTKTILTPKDLVVTQFEVYPDSHKILFLAFERGSWDRGTDKQQLYTVTTGLNFKGLEFIEPLGRIQRILDGKDYQNLQFDLSANGKTIVVQRSNRNNPADSGLWVIPEKENPRPLGIPGSNFRVAPNGKSIAVAQTGGIAIVPLTSDGGSSKFLAGYEKSLGFSPNGSRHLVVRNNPDYTRSLVLIDADGTTKELFQSINPITSCVFDPRTEKTLYCLKIDLIATEEGQYREEPFLAAIDLEGDREIPLLALPNYRDVQMSMSPDGVALLFDQVLTAIANTNSDLNTQGRLAIADGRLWLMPLPEGKIPANPSSDLPLPEELSSGFKPQWLP